MEILENSNKLVLIKFSNDDKIIIQNLAGIKPLLTYDKHKKRAQC